MQNVIEITNGVSRHPMFRMKEPVNLTIGKDEHIAIVGPNGGGKSRLVDIMTGRWPLLMNEVKYDFSPSASNMVSDNIRYIAFRDTYGDSDRDCYYQQRWNSQDMEITPIVSDLLPEITNQEVKEMLYRLFDIESMLSKHIVLLSSGEMRKFQLVKALVNNPRMLIMDNPFIGLDIRTRNMLQDLLQQLIEQTALQVILVLSKTDDIPSFITHVIPVENLVCGNKLPFNKYQATQINITSQVLGKDKESRIIELPSENTIGFSEQIVQLDKVSIRYGERTILKDFNWEIKNGEKWALSGENGSGKSTLLSLICADNPQSYACNISLFGLSAARLPLT